jgi:hypothetical protein
LGFASHRGLRRVASFRPFKSVQVGDTGPAESTQQGNLQRVGLLVSGLAGHTVFVRVWVFSFSDPSPETVDSYKKYRLFA